MLDKLYKKLHLIFVVTIMLIITLIFVIICANTVSKERVNEMTFFQRMSMLMIYQIEADDESAAEIMQSYEKSDSIFSLLMDSDGNVIYRGRMDFPTDEQILVRRFKKQQSSQKSFKLSERSRSSTIHGGIFEISGDSSDNYLGIPAKIVSKSGNNYDLTLIYRNRPLSQLLQERLIFYFLLWAASLAGIICVSHFLLKKALAPHRTGLEKSKRFCCLCLTRVKIAAGGDYGKCGRA